MPRAKSKKPTRRTPSQSRSQATVAAIVEATARVLVERGYARTTTNHIAAEAGISVGSFYEYFPGKDAAIAAVVEVLADSAMARAMEETAVAMTMPAAKAIHHWLGRMVQFVVDNAPLIRTLYQQVPFVWQMPKVLGLVGQIERIGLRFAADLKLHASATTLQDRAYVLGVAIGANVIQIATDPAVAARRDDLTKELSTLVLRFVRLD
jgi:AcrR family transcriptional regulator